MENELRQILAAALSELGAAGDSDSIEGLRVKYLGKKGELTAILRSMGKVSAEERPALGKLANEVRAEIEDKLTEKKERLLISERAGRLSRERIDINRYTYKKTCGR